MKILHINTFDYGGAAKACLRLHLGLLKNNSCSSKVLLNQKTQGIENTFVFQDTTEHKIGKKLKKKVIRIAKELKIVPLYNAQEKRAIQLQRQRKRLEMFSLPIAQSDITQSPLYHEADIIHLHWVANFLDWKTFFTQNTKPIVWTLHDQNPFLGIEHYAERFIGVDEKGYPIPRKYTELELKESAYWLNYKKKCLQNVKNLHIVSPSKWLLESSKNSELFAQYPHYHIPYGFPTDIFRPLDPKICREILGLPLEKKIILFVADSVESTRKGFAFLKKALEQLQNPEVCLCAIGSKTQLEQKENLIELGKIVDERLMAMTYAAADVFVIPSLEDNLPNTMIESLLCGTPVVGFPTGGVCDVVENKKNGYLCEEISVLSLRKAIDWTLENLNRFDRYHISNETTQKFNLNKQAEEYKKLYHWVLYGNA
jgi:glycosyltransferase involved in cell wall biosynthesis